MGKRRIWLFPALSVIVVVLNVVDRGNESDDWLSGAQKRASCIKQHPSTKHLVQPLIILVVAYSISDNLFVHTPQPIWAIIMIPDPAKFFLFSWTSVVDSLEESYCQLGQPITPSTISPSTTRAKPTWKN